MFVNVICDCVNELPYALECSATNSLFGEVAEPALDHVQPRTARWCEVHVEAFVTRQPLLHLRMFVRRVVVNNEMKLQMLWCLAVDLLQELQRHTVCGVP